MSDDKLDDLLRLAREEYHEPPETPRDALWRRIVQQRRSTDALSVRRRDQTRSAASRSIALFSSVRRLPWQVVFASAAAAALLILLWARNEPPSPPSGGVTSLQERIRESQKEKKPSAAYEAVATSHLTRTDALLTTLRQNADDPESRQAVTEWARELLADTRLLMDSPAGQDEELRPLLLDVELALAEIARLDGNDPGEKQWIEEGMDQRALLGRVRFKTKAATVSVGI